MDANKFNHGDSERTIGHSSEACGGEQQNQQQMQQEEPTTSSRRGSSKNKKRKLADDEEEDDEDDESLLITSTLQQQQSEPVEQSVKDKSDREEQQMEANRKRARDIRKRKKKMIADMQQKIVQLTMENQIFLQNTQKQQTEIQHLRAYVQQQEVMQQFLLQDRRQRLLGTLPLQLNAVLPRPSFLLPQQHSDINNTNTSNHTSDLNLLSSNTETTPQPANNGNSASNFPADSSSDLIQQLMRQEQILWGSSAGGGGGGNNPPQGNSIHIGERSHASKGGEGYLGHPSAIAAGVGDTSLVTQRRTQLRPPQVAGDSSSNELRSIDATQSVNSQLSYLNPVNRRQYEEENQRYQFSS